MPYYVKLVMILQGLLLLTQLTKGNTNIQKIVAFENAFERLLQIVSEEGCSDGGASHNCCFLPRRVRSCICIL